MDAMLASMPPRMFSEWIAYHSLEPFGGDRDAHYAGVIAATIANASPRKHSRVYEPSDFISTLKARDDSPQTPEQQQFIVRSIVASYAASLKKKGQA